tara:strand:- start:56 stop:490 length:435 start_codon:yes stop_codon:yes gene_type:complete
MSSILKVNTLTGVTTAGSIVVTGEGNSTTTNLQQGLCKAWQRSDGGAGTVVLGDSLNHSNITDNSTGDYSCTFTNNMASTNYTQAWDQKIDQASSGETNLCGLRSASGAVSTKTTSQYRANSQDLGSAQEDHSQFGCILMGDLA